MQWLGSKMCYNYCRLKQACKIVFALLLYLSNCSFLCFFLILEAEEKVSK